MPELLRILQVVLGIGLVIFVHELGHFLAARLCGVRVEIFSIGMGPRLFGWKRGATTYQVAALPIGGYVRWAGEDWRPEDGPAPRDLFASKSVGQRFFMYSGGVLMNVVFGLIVFPILFWNGVEFIRPAIGDLIPGSPAWQAELPVGAEVIAVDGKPIYEYQHLIAAVALGDPERCELSLRDPKTGQVDKVVLTPERGATAGFPVIGVQAPFLRDDEGNLVLAVEPNSPAALAGLQDGDRLLGFAEPLPGIDPFDQYRECLLEGRPLALKVAGPDGAREVTIEPQARPLPDAAQVKRRIGVRPPERLVSAVRRASALPIPLEEGDRVLSVNGRRILRKGDFQSAVLAAEGPLAVAIERPTGTEPAGSAPAAPTYVPKVLSAEPLTDAGRRALLHDVAIDADVAGNAVIVTPGMIAEQSGMRDGDRILAIDRESVPDWNALTRIVREASDGDTALALRIQRLDERGAPEERSFEFQPELPELFTYGVLFQQDDYLFRTHGLVDSLRAGAVFSWRFLQDTWLTLKRMLLGSISPKDALGGPVSIASISYKVAEAGLAKLFFFLCILSINLAFLNVLPIPVLDGGHLFFLLIEKVKGSPVSDRVLNYSQMVGVVLILGLLVFVTFNDLRRWLDGG